MRTTLTIDDDVLEAAKSLASHRRAPIGAIISELARAALRPAAGSYERADDLPSLPLRHNAKPVTLEIVNRLRDEIL